MQRQDRIGIITLFALSIANPASATNKFFSANIQYKFKAMPANCILDIVV